MNPEQTTTLVWVIAVLVDVAIRIAAIIVIPRNRKPSAAMAWLLAIFLIPYVGILFFLLVGSAKLPKRRRDKQTMINAMISEGTAGMDLVTDRSEWAPWFARVVELNTRLGAVPMVSGNTAQLIGDYNDSIAAMTAEINTATTFVHVEFYIVSFDATTKEFFAAMEAAVEPEARTAVAGTRHSGHRSRRQRHQRDLPLRLVQRDR